MSIKTEYNGDFESAIKIVLGSEGYYSNDSLDPGGETKFGISKRSYPNLNIKELTLEDAKQIYLRDYWSQLAPMEPSLKLMAMDAAVNQGLNFSNNVSKKVNEISMLTSAGQINYFFIERKKRYDQIVARVPSQIKYYNGWMNRLNHVQELSLSYINKINGGLS